MHGVPSGEGPAHRDDDDAGMGSLSSLTGGVSYMGLSSGSICLSVIERLTSELSAQGVPALSPLFLGPDQASKRVAHDSRSQLVVSHRLQTNMPVEHAPLPRLAEVMPLVDSYFRYFREARPRTAGPCLAADEL